MRVSPTKHRASTPCYSSPATCIDCVREDFYGPAQLCNFGKQDAANRAILQHRCRPEQFDARRIGPRPATASRCPTRRFERTTLARNPRTPSDTSRSSPASYTSWRGTHTDLESELLRHLSVPSCGTLAGELALADNASGAPGTPSRAARFTTPPTAVRQRWKSLPHARGHYEDRNCVEDHHLPQLCSPTECPRGPYASCARPALYCNTCPNATRRSDELLTWKRNLPDTRSIVPTWGSFPYELEETAVARDARCGCAVTHRPCQDAFANQTRRKLNN